MRTPPQSWYLDLGLIERYVEGAQRAYHHTAPIAMIMSLHAALGAILDEGLETVWARHRRVGARLQHELPGLGFRLLARGVPPPPPAHLGGAARRVDDATLRKELLATSGIEVGGGLGDFAGKAWRIGLMGHSAHDRNVTTLLGALRDLV